MANKIKFDVIDNYDPSESEEEYTETEKKLLNDVRKKPKEGSDSEEEFLAFDDEDEDDDHGDENSDFDDILDTEKFEHDSDVNDDEDDDMPDSRAWGKQKKAYYNTDFIDQDYSTFTAQEEELAKQEEDEARNIQQRLAKELDEGDFTLDVFCEGAQEISDERLETTNKSSTKLKTDFSNLTKRQKIDLFRKDAPEFDGLVTDFKKYSEESINYLKPVIEFFDSQNIQNQGILEFIKTKMGLTNNYCTNIMFYLLLKTKRIPIRNHPVVKRMLQVRQLLLQLEKKYEEIVKPEIQRLLEDLQLNKEIIFDDSEIITKKSTKKLGILKMFANESAQVFEDEAVSEDQEYDEDDDEEADEETENAIDEPISKRMKLQNSSDDEEDEEMDENEGDAEATEETEISKRGITYQISKNKGLTPHKKKELRNARVKNRNKYRKALVRRKGAVRPIRSQEKRYDGEMTGIKANVKRSIKIK